MGDSPESIAYQEGLCSITEQLGRLDDLRSRVGVLMAAASLSASFFGGLKLHAHQPLDGWEWAAVGCFVGVVFCSLAIISPWWSWKFTFSGTQLIESYVDEPNRVPAANMQRDLALHLDADYEANEGKLLWLAYLLQAAVILLGAEVSL